jgi:hypothetical protein
MGWEVGAIQILQLEKIVGKTSLMTNGFNHNALNLLRNFNFLIFVTSLTCSRLKFKTFVFYQIEPYSSVA